MTARTVLRWPSNRLRDVSAPVTDEDLHSEAIRTLAADLRETMLTRKGVGISAIQVGVPKRLFAVLHDDSLTEPPKAIVFINPVLVESSAEQVTDREGCLSLPGIFIPLARAKKVVLEALDLDGRKFTTEAEGSYARALQHEMDHLDGKVIADRVGTTQRDMMRRKLRRTR